MNKFKNLKPDDNVKGIYFQRCSKYLIGNQYDYNFLKEFEYIIVELKNVNR